MAEFGDVMAEFHKLPLPGKLAVGGAVGAVALIAYARFRAGQASSSTTTLNLPTSGGGGSTSSNAPAPGSSSTPSVVSPVTGSPLPNPDSGFIRPSFTTSPVRVVPGVPRQYNLTGSRGVTTDRGFIQRPTSTVKGPPPAGASNPAQAAQSALAASIHASLLPSIGAQAGRGAARAAVSRAQSTASLGGTPNSATAESQLAHRGRPAPAAPAVAPAQIKQRLNRFS